MGQYASNTTVSPEKTQTDIKETLRRYGAVKKEFLAFVMLPNGQSIGDSLISEIKKIAGTGKMPKLLPYSGA